MPISLGFPHQTGDKGPQKAPQKKDLTPEMFKSLFSFFSFAAKSGPVTPWPARWAGAVARESLPPYSCHKNSLPHGCFWGWDPRSGGFLGLGHNHNDCSVVPPRCIHSICTRSATKGCLCEGFLWRGQAVTRTGYLARPARPARPAQRGCTR